MLTPDALSEPMDQVSFPAQYGNISWGVPQGGGGPGFFEEATPGKKNGKTVCASRAEAPVITAAPGFYDKAVTVTAACADGLTLRFTTDGSTPTEKSKAFPENGVTVRKTASVRVRAFGDGLIPSETVTGTYLIGEELPVAVVCLATDEKYLFSKKTGALVKGTGSIPNYDKELEYPVSIERSCRWKSQLRCAAAISSS